MPPENQVAARLDQRHDQWVAFADDAAARLLVWRLAPGEAALVDGFVARECEPELSETPDIFVQLATSFQGETEHALALAQELAAQYGEATAARGEEHPEPGRWAAKAQATAADPHGLIATLCSFREHHLGGDSDAVLAVLLTPEQVSSFDAYQRWLRWLTHRAPDTLRFVILDTEGESLYAALIRAEPARVRAISCALDTPPMLDQLAQQGGTDTPGCRLRALQTRLGKAVEAGDLPAARAFASSALELALAHGWPHLGASLQVMLAAGCLGQGEHEQALQAYADAERLLAPSEPLKESLQATREEDGAAADAGACPPSTAEQLRLQTVLGRASVLLATRDYAGAAATYLNAASLAEEAGRARSALDAYRLASFCFAQNREPDQAWRTGSVGLRCGLSMDEQTRRTSTLPQLVAQLLHITETQRAFASHRKPLEQQLAESLGADWRAQLDQAAGS